MRRLTEQRVTILERRHAVDPQLTGRLMMLIPDLWPVEDRHAWETATREDRQDLVERRTGVRPNLALRPCWAMVVPASDDMLALSDAEKGAYLERHETRPLRAGHGE